VYIFFILGAILFSVLTHIFIQNKAIFCHFFNSAFFKTVIILEYFFCISTENFDN